MSENIQKISWPLAVYKMEWRYILSYRMDFWLNFVGTSVVQLTIAYFLWSSIFSITQKDHIGVFSFEAIMLYYVLAPLTFKASTGILMDFMFDDIYEGGLNKYLLYPINYFRFKLMSQYAHTSYYILQLILIFTIYRIFFKLPSPFEFQFFHILAPFFVILLCSYLYFMMACCLEMISFWADNVWSLLVLLRIIIYLFGGMLIPLSLFPEEVQTILKLLPFSYLLSFPINIFMNQINLWEFFQGIVILLFWCFFFTKLAQMIWERGSRQYSGVGI